MLAALIAREVVVFLNIRNILYAAQAYYSYYNLVLMLFISAKHKITHILKVRLLNKLRGRIVDYNNR